MLSSEVETLAKEIWFDQWGDHDQEICKRHPLWRFKLEERVLVFCLFEAIGAGVPQDCLWPFVEIAAWQTSAAIADGIARNPVGLFRYLFRNLWRTKIENQKLH